MSNIIIILRRDVFTIDIVNTFAWFMSSKSLKIEKMYWSTQVEKDLNQHMKGVNLEKGLEIWRIL